MRDDEKQNTEVRIIRWRTAVIDFLFSCLLSPVFCLLLFIPHPSAFIPALRQLPVQFDHQRGHQAMSSFLGSATLCREDFSSLKKKLKLQYLFRHCGN
jgi:hypothetical protein